MAVSKSARIVIVMVASAFALAGCKDPNSTWGANHTIFGPPAGAVSVNQLAERLGMRVEQVTACSAIIRGQNCTVVVFPDPNGVIYVNGRPLSPSGAITYSGSTMYVPATVEAQMRLAMGVPATPVTPEEPQPQVPSPTRPQPHISSARGTVVIDAGHGGKDPGTKGSGVVEKDVNLAVALGVADALRRKGVSVVMTRSNDTFVELDDRAPFAARAHANLFVSIHSNYMKGKPEVEGFINYVSDGSSSSSAAAVSVARHLNSAGISSHGGLQPRTAGFRVLKANTRPAVLVEVGFLSNSREAARLGDVRYQQRLSQAIADGIAEYLRSH